MKHFVISIIFILISHSIISQNNSETQIIDSLLNQWHKDVSNADFDAYFEKMTKTSIFIGTDASEIWTKNQFEEFAKPYFERKETWSFTSLDRNIYFSKEGNTAWFDELLDTWMGLCRGSGVLIKKGENWKIAHYVLSVTIPNDDMKGVIEVKKRKDSIILVDLKKQSR
jgi:ketosteroid isomerase-like protein